MSGELRTALEWVWVALGRLLSNYLEVLVAKQPLVFHSPGRAKQKFRS